MQYKTPHKIDLEDKVVGPLTMRQFGYLFTGGLFDYILFQLVVGRFGIATFLAIAFVPTLLALSLAFLRVQDQPFGVMIAAFFYYLLRGQRFIWQHSRDPHFIGQAKPKNAPLPPSKNVKQSDLDQLAAVLDHRGWSADEANGQTEAGRVSLAGRVLSSTEARPTVATPEPPSSSE